MNEPDVDQAKLDQASVHDHAILAEMARYSVKASTEFVGVIGLPVRHSLSPTIHNAAYAALGLDWVLGAFEIAVADVPMAINGARALGFRGLAVTMPHKQAAASAAEQLTPRAELLRAANTISFEAGIAVAESTDGDGLLDDLAGGEAFDPTGQICMVIGAGGAARAVILALFERGAGEIVVVNRTESTAKSAIELAPSIARLGSVSEIGSSALVVNATPISMSGAHQLGLAESAITIDAVAEGLGKDQLVVDLVYRPAMTDLLLAAQQRGARTRNGLGMLINQAARQIELWSGFVAPTQVMWEAAQSALDGTH